MTHPTTLPAVSLQVLTFNAWGLPYASKDDKFRLGKFAEYLKASKDLDLALLQEVWTDEYIDLLSTAAAEAGLSFRQTFSSNVLGSGLLVLSKHKIEEVSFHPFQVKGQPGTIHGEAMAGKGVAYVSIALPSGQRVHVFNAHTHANWVHTTDPHPALPGVKIPNDDYAVFRAAHTVEAMAFMRPIVQLAAARGELVVVGGDWNVPWDNLEMQLMAAMLRLQDAWVVAGNDPFGVNTCGDPDNVYTGSIIGGYVPERIDYVWTGLGAHVLSCEAVLKRIPGSQLNYSDHYGIIARVAVLRDNAWHDGCADAQQQPQQQQQPGVTRIAAKLADEKAADPAGVAGADGVCTTALVKAVSSTAAGAAAGIVPGVPISDPAQLEVLLEVCGRKLRQGIAESVKRRRAAMRRAALAGALAVVALGLQLYAVLAPDRHPDAATTATGVVGAAVIVPAVLVACFKMVMGYWMEKGLENNFKQLAATVDVWSRSVARCVSAGVSRKRLSPQPSP